MKIFLISVVFVFICQSLIANQSVKFSFKPTSDFYLTENWNPELLPVEYRNNDNKLVRISITPEMKLKKDESLKTSDGKINPDFLNAYVQVTSSVGIKDWKINEAQFNSVGTNTVLEVKGQYLGFGKKQKEFIHHYYISKDNKLRSIQLNYPTGAKVEIIKRGVASIKTFDPKF